MYVIDTSVWIEIYIASELGRKLLPYLSNPEGIVVPTIVQYEIFKFLSREHDSEAAKLALTFTNECLVQNLTSELAILAAKLSAQHKLHATDSIIFASAKMYNAELITCDAHFKNLPQVKYFEK